MWDLPRPGIEPLSPALAGGFFTTEPPGKLWSYFWLSLLWGYYWHLVGRDREFSYTFFNAQEISCNKEFSGPVHFWWTTINWSQVAKAKCELYVCLAAHIVVEESVLLFSHQVMSNSFGTLWTEESIGTNKTDSTEIQSLPSRWAPGHPFCDLLVIRYCKHTQPNFATKILSLSSSLFHQLISLSSSSLLYILFQLFSKSSQFYLRDTYLQVLL